MTENEMKLYTVLKALGMAIFSAGLESQVQKEMNDVYNLLKELQKKQEVKSEK